MARVLRVLLFDPHADTAESCPSCPACGHEPATAHDAAEALAGERPFDAAVLGLALPKA